MAVKVRPLPGSGSFIPTHTQGRVIRRDRSPVKGILAQTQRIQHPPRLCKRLISFSLPSRVT